MNEHLQRTEPKPLFDPLSPEFIRDPYPFCEQLRMTDPIVHAVGGLCREPAC